MKLLIPVAVLCFAVTNILTRLFQQKFPDSKTFISLYQALFCAFAGVAFFCGAGFEFRMSAPLCVSGILFGVLFFAAVFSDAVGYETGSMSLTAIIGNMSLIIPILYSCVTLKEEVTVLQCVGVGLILVTLFTSSLAKEKGKRAVSFVWIAAVLTDFVSNGCTAVIQKRYVLSEGEDTLLQFMSLAYFTAALIFAVHFMMKLPKASSEDRKKYTGKMLSLLILLSLVSGLGSFGGNALLGKLSAQVNGAILYPCINGGLCLVSALSSFLFFKEKISVTKVFAMCTGITAIVILNL